MHFRVQLVQQRNLQARSLVEVAAAAIRLCGGCNSDCSCERQLLTCSICHTALTRVVNSHLRLKYVQLVAVSCKLPLSAAMH